MEDLSVEVGGVGWDRFLDAADPTRSLEVVIPERGWLLLEVESASSGHHPLWFDLSDGGTGAGGRFVERGLERALLEVEPGEFEIRFGSINPHSEGLLRLNTRFVPRGAKTNGVPSGSNSATPQREFPYHSAPEPDPQPVPDDPDKDGEEGDDTETEQVEILPSFEGVGDPWWGCVRGEEPYNDFGLCATPLLPGVRVEERHGELRSADRDYFAFHLEKTSRVQILGFGSLDLRAVLMESFGRPLVLSERVGSNGAFEVLAELVAGDYLLRVEGAEGPSGYSLVLETEEMNRRF